MRINYQGAPLLGLAKSIYYKWYVSSVKIQCNFLKYLDVIENRREKVLLMVLLTSEHAQLLAAMTHPSRVLNLDLKAKAL